MGWEASGDQWIRLNRVMGLNIGGFDSLKK
jgi:hypothetical protein